LHFRLCSLFLHITPLNFGAAAHFRFPLFVTAEVLILLHFFTPRHPRKISEKKSCWSKLCCGENSNIARVIVNKTVKTFHTTRGLSVDSNDCVESYCEQLDHDFLWTTEQ